MDPQAAWDGLLSALADEDWGRVEVAASSLTNWLERGGFSPVIVGHPGTESDLELALAKAGCEYALGLVRARWRTSEILTGIGKEKS